MSLSALVLTLNEETNIADCLGSIPWRDDIRVLDSGSTDRTCEIAQAHGVTVHRRLFTDYAEQRNHGLALPFEHEWVLMLDADERLTPELAEEIARAIDGAEIDVDMFCVRRKDIFLGRWLKRSSGYPTWFPRILRRGRVRVERAVNEEYKPIGKTRQLNGHIEHYPFAKGLEWWFERHNRYSTMEAAVLERERGRKIAAADLFGREPRRRRAALKQIAYRVPGRPFLTFLYLYVLRLGFLDGRAGFQFASMRMAYEIMIDAKTAAGGTPALRSSPDGRPAPRQAP